MADVLKIDEVFEIAEEIERNGARFYRKASSLLPVSRAKNTLLDLAAMEDHHEKLFSEMREELAKKAGMEPLDPEDQRAQYLRAVAGGFVFPVGRDPSDRLTGNESLKEVLNYAIDIEKDSITYYLGIREAMTVESGKYDISQIVKEEMRHLTLISNLLHTIK